MNNEEISVLMADRCTRKEAERLLNNGTMIYSSIPEYMETMRELGETRDEKMLRNGAYLPDVAVVSYNGREYVVEYCN